MAGNLTSCRATKSLSYSLITVVMCSRAPFLFKDLVSTFKVKILQVSSFDSNFIFQNICYFPRPSSGRMTRFLQSAKLLRIAIAVKFVLVGGNANFPTPHFF